jgi:Transposase domain (DUF772)
MGCSPLADSCDALQVASNSNTKIDNTTFAIVPLLTASLILTFAVTLVAELELAAHCVTGPMPVRRSIPPERLLRALLLQAFYAVRSERQLMEQLDYNLLFRWFVGLSADRDIAIEQAIAVLAEHGGIPGRIASRHGSRVRRCARRASSSRPKPRSACHRPRSGSLERSLRTCGRFSTPAQNLARTNDIHCSTTDPDARLR